MKRYFGLAVAAGVLAGSMQMSADEAISITVRPAVTSYRGNAQLKVLVSRNEKNRVLVWEVDGPNYYRSSSIDAQRRGGTAQLFLHGEGTARRRIRRARDREAQRQQLGHGSELNQGHRRSRLNVRHALT